MENNENKEEIINEEPLVKTNKKSKKGKIFLVIIVLLIVLGCGCFAFMNYNMNKNNKTTVKTDTKEVKSEYRMSGNDLENFDLYFLKLENEAKNKVYSPLSIKYALEMLAEGSNGNTKKQIDAVIGDYKAKKYPNNEHMSFANAMFIKNTVKDSIKKTYTDLLSSKYNAEVIYDDFTTPDTINNWVSNKTFNLVNNLVDDASKNLFFLINALAIDMNWNNQIHCETSHKIPCVNNGDYHIDYKHEILDEGSEYYYSVTEYPYASEDDFYGYENYFKHEFNGKLYTKGGTVLADFNKYDIIKDLGEDKIREILTPEYEEWLKTEDGKNDLPLEEGLDKFIKELKENYGKAQKSTDFLVYEDENIRSFAKDLQTYEETTLQYVGIMPKNTELKEFISNTNKDEINNVIKNLKEVDLDSFEEGYATRIRGFIPFFKFEYELQLMEDLKQLGIEDVFDSEKADLTNLVESKGTFIDKAIHKANIEFSNDGIKASAATTMGGFGATRGPYFEHLFKVPVKDIDVTFNKPYMYLIRDKATGEVWFTGTVYEPIVK